MDTFFYKQKNKVNTYNNTKFLKFQNLKSN